MQAIVRKFRGAVGVVVGVGGVLTVKLLIIIVDRSPFAFAKADDAVQWPLIRRGDFGLYFKIDL